MPSHDEIIQQLRTVAAAPKRLATTPIWREVEHKTTVRLTLTVALEIGDIIEEGLYLNGRTLREAPEKDLSFTISKTYLGVQHNLVRIDWRPKRPHTPRLGPTELRATIHGSQWHPFEGNAQLGLSALRAGSNLPYAVPLEPEPSSFNDLLAEVAKKLLIENAADIPPPPWNLQGKLL
jgi:hypothetical protein